MVQDDGELLAEFVGEGDEGAFARVVEGHAGWLFAAAYRQLKDPGLAEDAVQVVFILLAERAAAMSRRRRIGGWLFETLRYTVKNIQRGERARKERERLVAEESLRRAGERANVMEIADRVDAAVAKLPEGYRAAILLRFYEEKPFEEVARTLGMTEAAARKRVDRGLLMLRQGMGIGVTASVMAACVAYGSEAMPAALSQVVAKSAAGVKGAAVPGSLAGTAKGVGAMMTAAKVKAVVGICVAVMAVPVTVVAMHLVRGAAPKAVVMVAAGVPAGKVGFALSKETTGIVGPLKADGTPDYVEAMNERVAGKGVKPEENGFVKWLEVVGTERPLSARTRAEVLRRCGAVEGPGIADFNYSSYLQRVEHLGANAADRASPELIFTGQHEWEEGEYPHVAGYLKSLDTALADMKEAVDRPMWWSPYVGVTTLDVILPTMGNATGTADALCARATMRGKVGDVAGLLKDVGTVRQLARRMAGVTLLERLVSRGIEARGCEALGAVVGSGNLTTAQLAEVEKWEKGWRELPEMVEGLDVGERWCGLDITMLIATGQWEKVKGIFEDGSGGATAMPENIDRGMVDWDIVLREVNASCDEEVAGMKMARFSEMKAALARWDEKRAAFSKELEARGAEKIFARDEGETKEAYSHRMGRVILMLFAPSVEKAAAAERELRLQWQMLDVLMEAAKAKAAHGQWPEKLEQIVRVPVPLDFYSADGKLPVMYVAGIDGARVYSVGRNGRDDGGIKDARVRMDDFGVGVVGNLGATP